MNDYKELVERLKRTEYDDLDACHAAAAIQNLLARAEKAEVERDELFEAMQHPSYEEENRLRDEQYAVSAAIGTSEYMDPPDGGSVTLAEQVSRMKAERDTLRAEVERLKLTRGRYVPVAVRDQWKNRTEKAEAELARLREMEPVAWRTFDGEGGFDYRNYCDNENYQKKFIARHSKQYHQGWVEPLYTAAIPAPAAEVPEGFWLAPMEPTEEMTDVIGGIGRPTHTRFYRAMRDAHLNKKEK